jgi:hypothetical protein
MSSALSKKQLFSLLALLGLIFVLPLSLLLTKQRQEIRKKAAGTGAIEVRLEPASSLNKNVGDTITYTVKLANGSSPTQIRVAGVEFTVRQGTTDKIGDFTISSFTCGTSLDAKAFGDVNEGKIRLVCYKTPGNPNNPLEIAANSTITLGTFQMIIKPGATGNYKISSKEAYGGRNNIPLAGGDYADLSNVGAEATLTIAGTATNTPVPTRPVPTSTPRPTWPPVPTSTPRPTSTPIPTRPVPTSTPGSCLNGEKGNLNCGSDGLIDLTDLTILLDNIAMEGPVPTPRPGNRSADIYPDGVVDLSDLTVLLNNVNF